MPNKRVLKPVTELYLFPHYGDSQEYFEKTGKVAPKYNPALPIKNWEDPSAAGKKLAIYNCIEWNQIDDPQVVQMPEMTGRIAASVNLLPPHDIDPTDKENAGNAWPLPVRELQADERLIVVFGGLALEKFDPAETPSDAGGFTAKDRQVLNAIANKLGVA